MHTVNEIVGRDRESGINTNKWDRARVNKQNDRTNLRH